MKHKENKEKCKVDISELGAATRSRGSRATEPAIGEGRLYNRKNSSSSPKMKFFSGYILFLKLLIGSIFGANKGNQPPESLV